MTMEIGLANICTKVRLIARARPALDVTQLESHGPLFQSLPSFASQRRFQDSLDVI